jgi:hypothetical protein
VRLAPDPVTPAPPAPAALPGLVHAPGCVGDLAPGAVWCCEGERAYWAAFRPEPAAMQRVEVARLCGMR